MWRLWRRIRAALAVLFLPGDRMPITQRDLHELRLEWAEWQMTFTGTLEKLNAWYARQAKREKRALERHASAVSDASEGTSAIPMDRHARKRALSRRVLQMNSGALPAPQDVPPPPTGDDES